MARISQITGMKTKQQMLWGLAGVLCLALLLLLRPMGMTPRQSLITGTLVLALVWWSAGCFRKWVTSAVLLIVFTAVGGTPLDKVYQFPLSQNFLVIFFAFLFSQGIANSGLTRRFLLPVMQRQINTVPRFLIFVAAVNILFIFVVPQPFARAILLAFIIKEYLDQACDDWRAKEVLLFAVYSLAMPTMMMFLRGDIILNYAVLSVAELSMTEGEWMAAMAAPSAVLLALECLLLPLVFRRELKGLRFAARTETQTPMTGRSRIQLAVILLTVIVMATESLHGIPGWITALAGSVLLAVSGALRPSDLKRVNYELLVFLTAAFSIGPVMKSSGVAELIFSRFSGLFPAQFGWPYLLLVLAVTMVLHMVLGSSVTTISVVVPGILLISAGVAPVVPVVLAVYVMVYNQYLLPVHNVMIMIGSRDYRDAVAVRFGVATTVLIPAMTLLLFYTWWQLLGMV